MTEPTDAEILELASQYWHCLDETESATEIELVRAALAKWGQPAQAAEPVAWAATSEDGVVEALGMNQSRRFDTPLYLAPQPVAREPLTPEQTICAVRDAAVAFYLDKYPTIEVALIREVERMHGIKGGQHGTE